MYICHIHDRIMTRLMTIFPAFTAVIMILCSFGVSGSLDSSFKSLDQYIATRDSYVSRKENSIEALKKLLVPSGHGRQDFEICYRLAREYQPYQYDSTLNYIRRCQVIASAKGDKVSRDRCTIFLGLIYTTSGHFFEAYHSLRESIDSTSLDPSLEVEYLQVMLRFTEELEGNSDMTGRFNIPSSGHYRRLILDTITPGSHEWRKVRFGELFSAGEWHKADSLNRLILASLDPSSHEYAINAYNQARVCEMLGDGDGRLQWLIRSAEGDIINAVKDYAALTTIVQDIMHTDVERAFRYLKYCQQDAIFYNAKLRPWQISQFFMDVETAYEARQASNRRQLATAALFLALLTAALIAAIWFMVKHNRKLTHTRKELSEINRQFAESNRKLSRLNAEIFEANRIKEEYIGQFLTILSENIDKMRSYDNNVRKMLKQGKSEELLKELSISTKVDDELDNFYRTFDTTFLTLYPDFVEEFNALLNESARITLKKGELLNTELRIFALIRLGIDDSSKIASLLHYSLSTIYNYKVKVRNSSIVDRSVFEEKVRSIGTTF